MALSAVASLLLCLLLLTGFLIADLLATGGQLVVERADPAVNDRLARISGGLLADSDEDVAETVTAPNVIEDAGIFHAVWWSRDSALGPALG